MFFPVAKVCLSNNPIRAVVCAFVMSWSQSAACSDVEADFVEIQVAYLMKFLFFVDWPKSHGVEHSSNKTLHICVAEDETLMSELIRHHEKKVNGKIINVEYIAAKNNVVAKLDIAHCQLLYLGRLEQNIMSKLLHNISQLSILTISSEPYFIASGGMIGFVLRDKNVVFDVSHGATVRSGLKLRSRLLRAARKVIYI